MQFKNFFSVKKALVVLILGQTSLALALDINRCPEQITIVYSDISRISAEELKQETAQLYNYSTDLDTSGPVRASWQRLAGVTQYTVTAKLNSKEDQISTPYCFYFTGTPGLSAKLEQSSNLNLIVNTPFGQTTAEILAYSPNGIQVSQNVKGRQFKNYAQAGYEDGGYIATIVVGTAATISVR